MTNSDKRALVEECRKSAMTAKEWCASKGINYSTYMQWLFSPLTRFESSTLIEVK
ncbi:IS66 family insertion sequence element accessory protein TnpA [Desulforamulus ferrireducens]|uniref:IS66 family insertion sequence element accessory protein TnpA n=1 Tax=Desulforamulus ferrireducens TaxID=1833852 RepID=UPI0013565B23|nr:hypothetical protein [Desulforamulus ferrireducens]